MVFDSYAQLQDPVLERTFRGHKDAVTTVAFKPSMTQLASGSLDHTVMLWNFKASMRAFRFVGHKAAVTSVEFSPSGNVLASASRDKTIRLWTPNVKADVTVFQAHTSAVRCVQFSSDGESLLSASDDKSLKIWSAQRTKFQGTLTGHLNWVRTCRFSPDNRLVVSGSDDKTVKLWDLRSKECIKTYTDHSGMVTSVAFHPSGSVIASASTDRSIKLFDIRSHSLIQHYGDAHVTFNKEGQKISNGSGVTSINFGGCAAEWLISTGVDGLIKVWDLKEGHLFYTLHGHKDGPTNAAAFSIQGDYFATGGSDSLIMVWKSNFNALKNEDEVFVHGKKPTITTVEPSATAEIVIDHVESPETIVERVNPPPSQPQPIENKPEPKTEPKTQPISDTKPLEDHINKLVTQIDVLTQTMSILESRLTLNEDRVEEIGQSLLSAIQRLEKSIKQPL